MKRLYTVLAAVLLTATMWAQSPQKMSYQAVIRNGSDQLITSHAVGIRVSILQGTTPVYVETHATNTNANGLVTIEIGGGTFVSGVAFSTIDWSAGTYSIKTETDPTGGVNYAAIVGTSQILSVPYALYAKTAASYTETDPLFIAWDKSTGINITASQVSDFQTSVTTNAAVVANTAKNSYPTADATKVANLSGTNTGDETATTIKTKLGITTLSGSNTGDQDLSGKVDKVTGKDLAPNGTVPGQMQYWNGSAWITVAPGSTGQVLTFVSGVPTWTTAAVGLGEVLNPTTGKKWMDRNLGALRVAGSSTDADAYGHLYQWGRGNDGHQVRTSVTTPTLSSTDTPGHSNFILVTVSPNDWRSPQNTNLWQGVNGVNNPCPSGYRLPTDTEWNAELLSWSTSNAAGAFASPLKLTVAGSHSETSGSLPDVGSIGYYWSSTVSSTNSRSLSFGSSNANVSSKYRARGSSVRCLKD